MDLFSFLNTIKEIIATNRIAFGGWCVSLFLILQENYFPSDNPSTPDISHWSIIVFVFTTAIIFYTVVFDHLKPASISLFKSYKSTRLTNTEREILLLLASQIDGRYDIEKYIIVNGLDPAKINSATFSLIEKNLVHRHKTARNETQITPNGWSLASKLS